MRLIAGKFISANSPVHSLSPLAKVFSVLILTFCVIFSANVADYLFISLILANLMLLSRVNVVAYLSGLKSVAFLIIFAVVIQLVYSGILPAIESTVRITLILLLAEVLTFTTRPVDLAHSLEDMLRIFKVSLKTRQELSMIMMIAVRFTPVMLEEVDRITKAQIARGAKIDSGRIWDRMKALVSITVPLMASAVRKAEEIALAMEVRRFHPGVKRTRYRIYGWGKGEWAMVTISMISLVLILMI